MQGSKQNSSLGTNGLAVTSLMSGILAWVFALALFCVNWEILPVFTAATLGAGAIIYVCTAAVGCVPPVGWIFGVVTGSVARSQIRQTGQGGRGLAQAGFIMSLVGRATLLLTICVLGGLLIAGTIRMADLSSYQY
jgi:hypothetical protein